MCRIKVVILTLVLDLANWWQRAPRRVCAAVGHGFTFCFKGVLGNYNHSLKYIQ